MIYEAVLITGVLGFSSQCVKILLVMLLTTKETRNALQILSVRSLLLEASVVFAFLFLIVLWALRLDVSGDVSVTGIGIAITISAILPTYSFFIEPFMILKSAQGRVLSLSDLITSIAKEEDIKIIETNADVLNAYASGILPYSRTIIVGKKVRDTLSTPELQSIIYHELGHLKRNHLLKLYLINLLVIAIGALSFAFLRKFIVESETPLLWVGLHGAFSAALLIAATSIAQRRFEYEADLYSAHRTKNAQIISALKKIDVISGGKVSGKSLNYPTLQEREANVQKHLISNGILL